MCSNSEYKAAKFHVRFIRSQSGFVYLYTSTIKNFIIINRKACVNVHALSIGLAFLIFDYHLNLISRIGKLVLYGNNGLA